MSPDVKTRPVLNCRLENVVVDKSSLHQLPFNQSGRASSLLTRTKSEWFWADRRQLGTYVIAVEKFPNRNKIVPRLSRNPKLPLNFCLRLIRVVCVHPWLILLLSLVLIRADP